MSPFGLTVRIIDVLYDFPFSVRLFFPDAHILAFRRGGLAALVNSAQEKCASLVCEVPGTGNLHFIRAPLERSWGGQILSPFGTQRVPPTNGGRCGSESLTVRGIER